MALEGVFGQYLHRESPLHALDPRTKMGLLVFCIALAFVAQGITLGVLYFVLAVAVGISRVEPLVFLKAVAPLSLLVLFPLVFNLFFVPEGDVLLSAGPFRITTESLYRAVYMSLRLFFLFATATLFTFTTSSIAIADAVRSFLLPLARFGVPAVELAMMFSIALRFVPTLVASYGDIRCAQQARGADLSKRGPVSRARGLLAIMVPLFAQAFRHAEDLAIAMESRCFHGGERTQYRQLTLHRGDAVAFLILLGVAAVLIALRFVSLPF